MELISSDPKIVTDGGLLRIFRKIGVIGDSLASGEFEYDDHENKGYWDTYDYSWGKYIERASGIDVTVFAHGGQTAWYCYEEADSGKGPNRDANHLFDPDNTKQAYLIALGVNDLKGAGNLEKLYGGQIGDPDTDIDLSDYHRNAGSFTGVYAKIIQRLQKNAPDAFFFLITMPDENGTEEEFSRLLFRIAGKLKNCFVLDLFHEVPKYDKAFHDLYFDGHMNAFGYLLSSQYIMTLADRVIREHPKEFSSAGFAGSGKVPYLRRRKTPLMGWSSWNAFQDRISEQKMKEQADALVSLGLKDCGYEYLNLDDGYFGGRDEKGNLKFHPDKFPNGIKCIAEYAHSLGLKAGIYSDGGDNTCCSYYQNDAYGIGSGLYGHEERDLKLLMEDCGFDFIKVDWCGGLRMGLDEEEQYTKIDRILRKISRKEKREIVHNICRWQFPGEWAVSMADSWRTGADIAPVFSSILHQIDRLKPLGRYCRPGHVNDPDMLQIGNGLSPEEERTHFVMWCMLSAPLMIGCDLTKLPASTLELLKNKEVIALDQDPLCRQARVIREIREEITGGLTGEIWLKELSDTDAGKKRTALAFLNRSDRKLSLSADLWQCGIRGRIDSCRELMAGTEAVLAKDCLKAEIPPHGCPVFLIVSEKRDQVPDLNDRGGIRFEKPKFLSWKEAEERCRTEGALLIDVRMKEEYESGHLPGAVSLEYTSLYPDVEKIFPDKTRPVIVYCATGKRCTQAKMSLDYLGYRDVSCLRLADVRLKE